MVYPLIDINSLTQSEVEAKNSEVLRDTETTISCKITGLAEQLDTVTWEKPGGGAITHNEDGYQIDVGIYESGSKSQTTVLTIPAVKNIADSVYTCVVSERRTDVNSNVFSKL